jgi:hypothetical protein
MGIRTFWILLIVAACAVAATQWSHAKAQPALPGDYGPEVTVVDIPREAEPAPIQASTDPVEALAPEHLKAIAPKPPAQPMDAGGTLEQATGPKLVRMPDDSLIVDSYWKIAGGNGTAAQPYQLLWDLLLSAQNAFENELPPRASFLNGKEVVITGYTVKHSVGGPTVEFSMTDQQMDNCPSCRARSVFATVVVKLKTPENIEPGVLNVYTVRGKLKAVPIRRDGFLLGVYYIDDGEILSRTR